MIDKQTELWFSQPMIGTIGDVAILPIPPDKLKEFAEAWDYIQETFFSKPPLIAKSDEVIIELNGIRTAVKYDTETMTIAIP